jgi:hypothetical protein
MELKKMDITTILVEARRAVENAELPAELQQTGFAKAIDLLSPVERGTLPQRGIASRQSLPLHLEKGSSALDSLADKLTIDVSVIGEIYHEQDGELEVTVPVGKLEAGKMAGTRQLALLVTAGRQGAGLEEYTSIEKIRAFAELYKRYDSPNFSRTVEGMKDEFSIRKDGKRRLLRVSRPGWEAAAKLIRELGGIES